MDIVISTGEYDIIGSGTIVGNYDTPLEFKISSLTYVFEFKNDASLPTTRLEFEQPTQQSLRLKFINFNNSLGQGPSTPTRIGNIGTRKLHLNYRIYSLTENSGKTIHYTFLLEKEVPNGK